MAIEIVPLTQSLGAEVRNIDLARELNEEQLRVVRQAWLDHLVLVFRTQHLSDDDLVRYSRHFGDLDRAPQNEAANLLGGAYVPDLPEVTVISNIVVDGVPIGALGAGESEWHTDMSYNPAPPSASLLYALEVPDQGGETGFTNMYLAYDTLPADLRAVIAGRTALHDATYTSAGGLRKGYEPISDVTKTPGARHPLVRTHPETGRRALFLGRRRNGYVEGLSVEESDRLLDALWAHATQQRFVYVHHWRVGDLVMWDNRCTMHRRNSFDEKARRLMHRTQVKGDVPRFAA
jgi:taurine dioxygenase